MEKSTYTDLLAKLLDKMSLFETSEEADSLLQEALSLMMEKNGSSQGAAYLYNDKIKELVFRVGFDKGDLWSHSRFEVEVPPESFSLESEETGLAFTTGLIKIISYDRVSDTSPFYSKVIVPITRGPEKIGLFIMVHRNKDAYRSEDMTDLKKAVSLFGDMMADASILIERKNRTDQGALLPIPKVIKGIRTSHGLVEGIALPIWSDMERASEDLEPAGTVEEELEKFHSALNCTQAQLNRYSESISKTDEEMVTLIFTAQLLMLKDENFTGKMAELIETGQSASQAIRAVVKEYADLFASMSEARLAEKAQDVRDLGFRLLTNMGNSREEGFSYENHIAISRHIYPSDLYRLFVEGVSGIVLRGASVTAHISILAQSLSLPVLITDDEALLTIEEGTPLLLDGDGGKLYIDPEEITRNAIREERFRQKNRSSFTIKGSTADGTAVNVMANVNILKDARDAVEQGAEGIGLYRSEFPFIIKNDFLSEEQQYKIYSSIVQSQQGKPVIMRTADIGGDKLMQGRQEKESNPFLGVRGIRFSLSHKELFHDQLRAMLRAGYGADLRILFPMVTDAEEIVMAKEEIDICRRELKARGVEFNDHPKIGAMVELPSAAVSIADLAEEVDFLSIGSNDLTMYLLAVDRTNDNLSHLYRSYHPTVLRVLSEIVRGAATAGKELSVCGDIATDSLLILFLVGLGIRKLSVPPTAVEGVKALINQFDIEETEGIARDMLSLRRISEMEKYRDDFERRYDLTL